MAARNISYSRCVAMLAATLVVSLVATGGAEKTKEVVVEGGCAAPLVVFGASMVDVGQNSVAFPLSSAADFPPFGVDYFGRPAARFSNGRVITDFLSQGLGYGLLDPYLDSVNPRFEHGISFASAGSTARNSSQTSSIVENGGSGLFPLHVQVQQYKLFKAKIQHLESKRKELTNLPTTKRLAKGIHIMMHAQNDYQAFLLSSSNVDAVSFVVSVVDAIESGLRQIHEEGARTMIVINLLPIGCAPAYLAAASASPPLILDEDKCVASYNNLANIHNSHLKSLIELLREELSWDGLVLFDLYAMYLDAIRHPSKYGVTQPFKVCCGGNKYNANFISCGKYGEVNGTIIYAERCPNPTDYISWDGLHPTESFAKQIALDIIKGSNTYPHFSIDNACQ